MEEDVRFVQVLCKRILKGKFAGTFVTDDLIPKLDREKKIADYTYNPF